MLSAQQEQPQLSSRGSQSVGLMDHPVFTVMSSVVRSLLSAEARQLNLQPGDEAPENALVFVMRGALALYEVETEMAVGILGPNSILGGAGPALNEPASRARAVLDTMVYYAPLDALLQANGVTWSNRFLTAHTTSRARLMGSERICREWHSTTDRLAKWCLRLEPCLKASTGTLTPEALAELLGVTEAELAEAWQRLAAHGALSAQTADFVGMDAGKLKRMACGCDETLGDGGIERRSRRRLLRRH